MEISDYEQYYQKGGTYVLPIEVFNELWGEMESWKNECKQKETIIKGLDNTIQNLEEVMEHKDNIIKEAREYIQYQLEHLDFEKDIKAKMLGAMVFVMLDEENK